MATIVQTVESSAKIRVALIIEGGGIKPVWFEECGNRASDRVFIRKVGLIWTQMEGAAKIINFAVWDGKNNYRLSLNTKDFTWSLGITVESPFPPHSTPSWRFRPED